MAQEKSGDSIVARDSAVVHDSVQVVDGWKAGPRFLSVQGVFLPWSGEEIKGFAVDVDAFYLISRGYFGFGARAGWHNARSVGILDYGYTNNHFDLLARFSAVSRIVRFDLYYGYGRTLNEYWGFFDPTPGVHHRTIDALNLGAEFRIYLLPGIVGLLIRGELRDNINQRGAHSSLGLGFVACWQP
ncbi:MAG: hypothetical protein ABIR47_06575 [Candidatus Kapaibacterium sp.]